jgi:hypothetical protein
MPPHQFRSRRFWLRGLFCTSAQQKRECEWLEQQLEAQKI